MDLRSMQALIWMLLLGFLIFVPGSTLNAIESTAVTAAATTPKTETPSIEATPKTTTTTTTTVTTKAQSKATPTAPTLLKDTTVLRTHSITQAAISTTTKATTRTIQATTPTAAASSITIITRSGAEFAGRKSAALASAAFVIKATTTTTTAVSPATGSSLTRNATNDRSPTTIGTKASLNSSATSAGSSSSNNIRSPSGSAQVARIVGPGAEGGAKSQTVTATAAIAATPTTTITASTTTTTTDACTTIESLAAAAAAQLVATQMPPTANNEETESQRAGNTNTYAAAATIAGNNNDYNKGTNYYYGNAVDAQALGRGTASAAHQVRPLQRPKIYNSNNYNYNNNNYSYNRNDLAYMREQQQLYASLQRQQQQQYAQQLVQLPPDGHNFATNGSSVIVAIDTAAVDRNLVIDDRNFQPDKRLHNQSMANVASNLYERAPTTTTTTTAATRSATHLADAAAATASANDATTAASTTTTTAAPTTRRPRATTTPKPAPVIDDYQTIISQAGTHAYLPCNVKQLVKKPISWLRMRDGHILTVDQTTFIADQRFQSIYAPNPERWSLQIKYVQLKDAGTYECQVSTEPKASAIVSLRIVEPKTELIGEPTRHVKAGSQVKLRCIISQALEPPLFINWFYNQKQIYLHNRKGWRTEIERIELPPDMPTTTTTTTTSTTTSATTTTTTTTAAAAAATTTMSLTTSSNDDAADVAATMAAAAAASGATAAATHSAGSSTSLAAGSSGAGVAVAATEMSTTLPAITKTTNTTTSSAATTPTTTAATAAATSTSAMTPTTTTMTVAEVKQITTASLIILAVEKQDSGNYTCSPSNSAPKTVILHVLNGEYSASAITSGVSGNIIIGNHSKLHCGNMLAILTLLWIIEFVLVEQIWKWQRQQCSNAATNAAAAAIRWNNEPPTTTMHREWNKCGASNSRRHIRSLQIVASARNNCHNHSHSDYSDSDWNTNCIGSTARSQRAAVLVSSIVSGSGNLQPWPINTHTLEAQEKT